MLGSKCSSIKSPWYRTSPNIWRNIPANRRNLSQRQNVKPIKSLYVDTTPPKPKNLEAATLFFRTHAPLKSWTATEWRKNQPHNANTSDDQTSTHLTPEVTFLGRSNSGKSSLMNAILLDPALCRVGPKPGKTTIMHAWSLSPIDPTSKGARRGFHGDMEARLNVLDMPGYGHGSHGDWGADIMKYLTSRRQLRRAFVLVNPVHGLKKGDLQMLELLRVHGVSHQMIACKCDHEAVGPLEAALHGLKRQLEAQFGTGAPSLLTIGDILAVGGLGDGKANVHVKSGQMKGVEDVRWAILRAAGLEDYAMALLDNGGVLPNLPISSKAKSQETDLSMDSADLSTVQVQPMGSRGEYERTVSSSSGENVGVGIKEFMEMADLPEEKIPPTKSRSLRQQRMRRRVISRRI